jgi:predicted transcriptional regulator
MSRYTTNIRVTWGEEEEMSHVLTITVEKMDPNMKLQYTVNPSYEVTGKIQQNCSQRGKVSYKKKKKKYIIL